MPWARLDDTFWRHDKKNAAGPLGVALFTAALSYCNDLLTDGFVPGTSLWQLVNFAGLTDQDGPVTSERVADNLVRAGLWFREEGGYRVHDYLHYNKNKATILAERQEAKERMQNFRRRSSEVPPNIERSSETPGNPVPGNPVPGNPDPGTRIPDPEIKTAGAIAPGADAPRMPAKPPSKKPSTNGRAPPAHAEQYDALIDGFGYDRDAVKKSKPLKGCLNEAAKSLDEQGFGRDDILFIIDDKRREWKGTDFGPMAVAKWAATYERGP